MIRVNIEDNLYDVIVAKTQSDINKGMSIYQYKPIHGMLFLLNGSYSLFTMNNVNFPLMVYLYDSKWNMITKFNAEPGEPTRKLPQIQNDKGKYEYPYYMIELPI